MEQLIQIQLTDADARLFVQFQKRRKFIQLMESVGAFDLKKGSVTVNFDEYGGITSVDVYKRNDML